VKAAGFAATAGIPPFSKVESDQSEAPGATTLLGGRMGRLRDSGFPLRFGFDESEERIGQKLVHFPLCVVLRHLIVRMGEEHAGEVQEARYAFLTVGEFLPGRRRPRIVATVVTAIELHRPSPVGQRGNLIFSGRPPLGGFDVADALG
jgi:hypothetical protein